MFNVAETSFVDNLLHQVMFLLGSFGSTKEMIAIQLCHTIVWLIDLDLTSRCWTVWPWGDPAQLPSGGSPPSRTG